MLAFLPGLQRLLPRPGRWMETLKQFLAFPLYGTAAWLIWVLSFQVGPAGLMAALAGLVLIAFGAWAYGLAQGRSDRPARAFRGLAAAAGLAAVVIAASLTSDRSGEAVASSAGGGVRGLHPAEARRAARCRKAGLRQYDSGLVHHLPGQ